MTLRLPWDDLEVLISDSGVLARVRRTGYSLPLRRMEMISQMPKTVAMP
jgi:hypothetical protein